MNNFRFRSIKRSFRRNMGLQPIYAVMCNDPLGTTPYDQTQPGNIWVQIQYANGFGSPISVRGPTGNSVQIQLGNLVELQPTSDNRLKIADYNVPGNASAGVNVLAANTPQLQSGGYVGQQSLITALVTPQQTPDLTVAIKSWAVIASGTYTEFPGNGSVDLSSYVPSSGNNRYVVIFVQNDYATVVVHASTARSTADLPLNAADIQECLTAASLADTPLAAIRLYGGQTQILQADIVQDLRQLINTAQSTGAGNVVGPGSSTDNAVARFDNPGGTTPDVIQNSGVIIDDSNNVTIPGIETTQSGKVRKIRVVTAAGAVTVATTDDIVVVNKTVGAATVVNLPSSPTTGQTFWIHDGKGDAFTNNITLTPASGNINGATTFALTSNYATAICTYNGTQWDASVAFGTLPYTLVGNYEIVSCPVVRVIATSNISVGGPGALTVDGVTLNTGDWLLLTAQSTASENGPWEYRGSTHAMLRPSWWRGGNPWPAFASVKASNDGTTLKGTFWYETTGGTIDTNNETWTQLTVNVGSGAVTGLLPAANMTTAVGDSGSGGTKGAVPAPATGDAVHGLFGDMTFAGTVRTLVAFASLGADTPNIDLTSISGNYKHLQLLLFLRTDRASNTNDNVYLRFNNDSTAANYFTDSIRINGSTLTAQERLGVTATGAEILFGAVGNTGVANDFSVVIVDIFGYQISTNHRAVVWRGWCRTSTATGNQEPLFGGCSWLEASTAINRITILPVAGSNFKSGSSYMLYGIS